jgi:hypothetical protein
MGKRYQDKEHGKRIDNGNASGGEWWRLGLGKIIITIPRARSTEYRQGHVPQYFGRDVHAGPGAGLQEGVDESILWGRQPCGPVAEERKDSNPTAWTGIAPLAGLAAEAPPLFALAEGEDSSQSARPKSVTKLVC